MISIIRKTKTPYEVNTMPLKIIRNDITKVEADAIVNTANPRPIIGSGTDSAIHAAAGPELLAARQQIGEISVGSAAATPAFGLPAKYVLHTVGPSWIDGKHGEEEKLLEAYQSALALADSLNCRSVAFPLLSAGCYAFPTDIALSVALRAFSDHLLEHDLQIILTLFDAEAFGLAGSSFDDLKSYVDDNYVDERLRQEDVRYSFSSDYLPQMPAAGSAPASGSKPASKKDDRRHRFLAKFKRTQVQPESANAPDEAEEVEAGKVEEEAEDSVRFSIAEEDIRDVAANMPAARFSLKDILEQQEPTFSDYLLDLIEERGGKASDVYKRAEVSKQLFSKIISNRDYQPTKNTVLQLAIGLQLDVPQTKALLNRAGYALTRSSKTDLVVQYYIERNIHNVPFINLALDDCGLPLLGTGLKA